jgi:hypothetical protein
MQSKLQFGKPAAQQSKLSFGGGNAGSKPTKQEEKKLAVDLPEVQKPEEKMSDDDEAPVVAKKSMKKRALVEDDEEVATIEESVPTPSKPAPVSTPGKDGCATAKKVKTNDGKEVEPIKAIIKEVQAPA